MESQDAKTPQDHRQPADYLVNIKNPKEKKQLPIIK